MIHEVKLLGKQVTPIAIYPKVWYKFTSNKFSYYYTLKGWYKFGLWHGDALVIVAATEAVALASAAVDAARNAAAAGIGRVYRN